MTIIAGNMSIMEVVELWPQTAQIFIQFGMGCLGCAAARFENIEQGAAVHGIDIEALLAALNESIT